MSAPIEVTTAPIPVTQFLRAGHALNGVVLRTLQGNRDHRGCFTEFHSDRWANPFAPAQWSLVESRPGTLRGMHLHRRHDESVLLIQGRVFVGLRDIRPGSPTEHRSALYELCGDDRAAILFPRGLVHGWYFTEPSVHIQAVSETYPEYHGDDNLGCHWSDPALEIPWPGRPSLVAERADAFPGLDVLVRETLRHDPGFRY